MQRLVKPSLFRRALASCGIGFGSYEGASTTSKSRASLGNNQTPRNADQERTPWERAVLMARARYLYRNFGLPKAIVKDMRRYSVGSGLVRHLDSADRGWADAAAQFLTENDKIVELSGRFTFGTVQGMISEMIDVDGDNGLVLVAADNPYYGFIQIIEAHNFGTTDAKINLVDGVRFDKYNAPISYYVRDGEEFQPIPAANFVHCWEPDRLAARGVSRMHAGVNKMQDIKELLQLEMIAQKNMADISLIESNATGEAEVGASYLNGSGSLANNAGIGGEGIQIEHKEGGTTRYIKHGGADLKPFQSERPSQTFTGFLDYNESDILLGFEFPSNWKNLHKEGGATLRAAVAKIQRRFDERNDTIAAISRRIDVWRLARASKAGGPLSSKALPQDWYKVSYIGPAKLTADAGRENKEDREDVRAGLLSVQEYYARFQQDWRVEYGKTFEAAELRFEMAQKLATKNNVSLEYAMTQIFDRSNGNNPLPPQEQGGTPTK